MEKSELISQAVKAARSVGSLTGRKIGIELSPDAEKFKLVPHAPTLESLLQKGRKPTDKIIINKQTQEIWDTVVHMAEIHGAASYVQGREDPGEYVMGTEMSSGILVEGDAVILNQKTLRDFKV